MHIVSKVAACGAVVYGVMYAAASKNMVPLVVKQRVEPSDYLTLYQRKDDCLNTYTLVAKSSLLGLTWSDAFATFDLWLGTGPPRLLHFQVIRFDGFAMSHDEKTKRMFECIDAQATKLSTKVDAVSHNQGMRTTLEQHGFVLTEEDYDAASTDLLTKVLA